MKPSLTGRPQGVANTGCTQAVSPVDASTRARMYLSPGASRQLGSRPISVFTIRPPGPRKCVRYRVSPDGLMVNDKLDSVSFSFAVAERAMKQEVLPGTISSDLHQFNVNGPVFDLATTLSKYLHLGLTLEQVVGRVTVNPARLFRFPHDPGSLRVGSVADLAIFAIAEGDFVFRDAMRVERVGHRRLVTAATVKAGRVYGEASIPVAGA